MSLITTQARRLRWRVRFLADPGGVAGEEPLLRARDFPLRDVMLADARALSLRERLAFISPFGRRRRIEEFLLLERLRRAPDGHEYFDLGEQRIFFRPDHAVKSDSEMLDGILLILREAYLLPCEFFSPEVRIAPGDTVLDLGGNVGTSALLFSRLTGPEGRVFSFEPVFHGVLRRNLRENGAGNVRVIPLGVSDRAGAVEFAITDRGVDARMASPTFGGGTRMRIEMVTLDGFVEREGLERVDFVKMDIEGAEELALRGAERTIERFRPRWSIASYHTDPAGEKQHPKLVRHLAELGYRVREAGKRHIYAW